VFIFKRKTCVFFKFPQIGSLACFKKSSQPLSSVQFKLAKWQLLTFVADISLFNVLLLLYD